MNKMSVSIIGVLAFVGMQVLLLLHIAEAHTVHIVGDSIGWTVPQNTDEYENWADKNMFAVGDILFFNFTTNAHDVVEVPEGSYDSCTSNNNITEIFTTGPTNITLSSVGEKHYICTIGRHCVNGQKLSVTVTTSHHSSPSPSLSPAPMSPGSTPPPPPGSSASGVCASFFLVLLSIVVGVMC